MWFWILWSCSKSPTDSDVPPPPIDSSAAAETDEGQDSAPPVKKDEGPSVLRLGPPAPAVGSYGIATTPGSEWVYVSNLHVPFITLIDPETAAWAGSLDLREVGIEKTFFPKLFTHDGLLYITHFKDSHQLLRVDLESHTFLDPIQLHASAAGVTATEEGIWLGMSDGQALRYEDGRIAESVQLEQWPIALAVEEERVAVIEDSAGVVALFNRQGTLIWRHSLELESLSDIELIDSRVFVSDRISGQVVSLGQDGVLGSVVTGSDTFSLQRDGEHLLVVNRQGASLPDSGAYEGGGGLITRLSRDLEVLWSSEVSKTIHFLAWDGQRWWTANEDALKISAVDPLTGEELLRGPVIGLTLDHIAEHQGGYLMGSHLTDELWSVAWGAAGWSSATASAIDTCGWPFLAVPVEDRVWVPCQEDGTLLALSHELEPIEQLQQASTFHPACEAGLCTGHAQLIGASSQTEQLVWSNPASSSVHWEDGRSMSFSPQGEAEGIQHFDLLSTSPDEVIAFEPIDARIYRLDGESVLGSFYPAARGAPFPLVQDEDRIWVGHQALSPQLDLLHTLREDQEVLAAGEGMILLQEGEFLSLLDRSSLEEVARVSVFELASPPYVTESDEAPLRFYFDSRGWLVVANVFRGTLERRRLPDLELMGDGSTLALGHWSGQEGLY